MQPVGGGGKKAGIVAKLADGTIIRDYECSAGTCLVTVANRMGGEEIPRPLKWCHAQEGFTRTNGLPMSALDAIEAITKRTLPVVDLTTRKVLRQATPGFAKGIGEAIGYDNEAKHFTHIISFPATFIGTKAAKKKRNESKKHAEIDVLAYTSQQFQKGSNKLGRFLIILKQFFPAVISSIITDFATVCWSTLELTNRHEISEYGVYRPIARPNHLPDMRSVHSLGSLCCRTPLANSFHRKRTSDAMSDIIATCSEKNTLAAACSACNWEFYSFYSCGQEKFGPLAVSVNHAFRPRGSSNTSMVFPLGYLVAKQYLPPCPKDAKLEYMDGNRTNNRIANLRWLTLTEKEPLCMICPPGCLCNATLNELDARCERFRSLCVRVK